MTDASVFPDPPSFAADQMAACRASGDYSPILFEWYKYTAHITNTVASLDRLSPAAKKRSASHFGVLIGLLNRCCRLMLANVALSHEGLFGETTAIVDRCIFESCAKVLWLCNEASDEYFERYMAEGLKTEIALTGC